MITAGEIYRTIDAVAPFSSALEYDNAGLLVGSAAEPVSCVLLALDITSNVVEQAKQLGAQLIVSHHPVIFHPVRALGKESVVYQLAQNGICAICAHTNLDMAPQWGVNAQLAKRLQLMQIQPMTCNQEYSETLLGKTEEKKPIAFAEFAKKALGVSHLSFCEGKTPVRSVALCSGAGGEFIASAIEHGADAFVTGEVKHHEWLLAKEQGLTVVCAGHFATEQIVLDSLKCLLNTHFPTLKVQKAAEEDPVSFV